MYYDTRILSITEKLKGEEKMTLEREKRLMA
jgi:hypothetical protein